MPPQRHERSYTEQPSFYHGLVCDRQASDRDLVAMMAERYYNLKRWTAMPQGGHRAPREEPERVVDDIRAVFRALCERKQNHMSTRLGGESAVVYAGQASRNLYGSAHDE
jgi:hypothetical protein